MHSEWKVAIAAWLTLCGVHWARELFVPMRHSDREPLWETTITRGGIVLAVWLAFHLWAWAIA